ncbi:hypothetical protein Tco_0083727 [Tanacetum coccineum]
MGKVSKWFRGLLGMKKDKENMDNSNAKTKRRWSFGKSMKDLSQRVTVENDSTRMRSCMSASEKEQNNHAIAIAETAVAAADVAVAGAQAAVTAVRLTSDGRGTLFSVREKWAATKKYLARRNALSRIEDIEHLIEASQSIPVRRVDSKSPASTSASCAIYALTSKNTSSPYNVLATIPTICYEILLQEEFEIGAVKQYSNTCRGVAKQAFHRKCLPLVAPKRSKTLVAKCGPIQRLSNISIGCDSMEMLNVASIGRDRM